MRLDPGQMDTERLIAKMEKEVAKQYAQASKEVQAKLDKYLADFARKDAVKRAKLRAGEITTAEYNKWRIGQIMTGKRWAEMRDTLATDLRNYDKIARSAVVGYCAEAYALNHDYATFEIEHDSLIDTSYTLSNRDAVEYVLQGNTVLPPPGDRVKRLIAEGKAIRWEQGQVESATLQAILQGESIPKIAKRVAVSCGETNKKACIRYARTAMIGAQNAGRQASYERAEAMGINLKKQWLAALDMRTRPSHVMLDGEMVGIHEKYSNGCRYPGDPQGRPEEVYNCRCCSRPRVDGINADASDLSQRYTKKLGDMTYEQWKRERSRKDRVEYGKRKSNRKNKRRSH